MLAAKKASPNLLPGHSVAEYIKVAKNIITSIAEIKNMNDLMVNDGHKWIFSMYQNDSFLGLTAIPLYTPPPLFSKVTYPIRDC